MTVTAEGVRTGCAEGRRTVGVRAGNNANNGNLSARYLNANNSAGNTNSYYCGSAKVWHKKMMRPSPVPGSGRHTRPAVNNGGRRQGLAEMPFPCQLLKLDFEVMNITKEQVLAAMGNAAKGHSNKEEVGRMMANSDAYADMVVASIASGEYRNHLRYRKLTKRNSNGKVRKIDSPLLFTFVLQHLFLVLAKPLYDCHDNMNALNCKPGCGITASDSTKSVIRRLKHLMYDRRDLGWCVIIDQRKCYEHIRPKVFRKEMRKLTTDRELVEFGIDVGFVDGRLPIGTPTSPLMHHIVMLEFDHWSKQVAPFSLRYADDCFFATRTKEEANELKWRVQNFWWYELQVRAKASAIRVQPLDKEVSLCGYVVHRNPDKGVASHNKGYTTLRQNIRSRASRCRKDESWASYYGLLRHADGYNLMLKIERKMKLKELTKKIRLNRSMDAPNVNPKDLAGKQFTIYDYEIRSDSKGTPNWIKCLIGIDEKDEDGNPTGRMKAFEFHGSYMYLVEFMTMAEKTFGKKNMLPLEEMEVENQCGYIFKGSTNQIEYI
ncbi:MAG: hypothetical protein J6S82_04430 [Bacteroidales bacterium]|nr:hypothetical protein [Bacteroidales bacterium]